MTTDEATQTVPHPVTVSIPGYPLARVVGVWEHANNCKAWRDERVNSVPGEACYSSDCGYRFGIEVEYGKDLLGVTRWVPVEDRQTREIAARLAAMVGREKVGSRQIYGGRGA